MSDGKEMLTGHCLTFRAFGGEAGLCPLSAACSINYKAETCKIAEFAGRMPNTMKGGMPRESTDLRIRKAAEADRLLIADSGNQTNAQENAPYKRKRGKK